MGGKKTLGLAIAAVATGVGAWWLYPSSRDNGSRRAEQPARPGIVGAAFNPPMPVEPPARPAEPALARPTAPAGPAKRPRPSSMSVYVDAAPPTRPAPAAAASGPAAAQTVAGMPVLRAEMLIDAGWYLMPGDKIQCQSNEPLTERTGARFSVNIPEDVRGRDGINILVPRGSRAVGRVAKGVDQGERRLIVVMDTIEGPTMPGRPTVVVPLGGTQAGDLLGGADLEGNVDTHFWARLGSVAAYTVLDAVGRVGSGIASSQLNEAINGSGRNGTNVNIGLGSGIGGGRGLAGRSFDYEINRPPSFDRPQGQSCTIFVQSPLDFRAMRR